MRLFHFSEESDIAEFAPRPVRVPSVRPEGMEWLNGPLVWAIAETHQKMYLFPRQCPRILLWATPRTTEVDCRRWLGGNRDRTVAYIEREWYQRLQAASIIRYEFAPGDFIDIRDAGMWVCRRAVRPVDLAVLTDLPKKLGECGTDLHVVDSLVPLREARKSDLHFSGIRLRNARDWG